MPKKQEEIIVSKLIKVEKIIRRPSQEPKDILFRKHIESRQKDIKDIKSIQKTKDNLGIDKIETALQAFNPKGSTKDILRDVLKNLDGHYDSYLHYRRTRAKVSDDSIRNSNAAFRYLKYFINKHTILDFSFFKELQNKLEQIPSNFFKYTKYYTKNYEEVLELREIENYKTLSAKTINNHMSNYKSFFDYLIYEEIITENPLLHIQSLKEEESDKIEFSPEDLVKIFSSSMEKTYINMCKFALYSGARLEEILSIKKEDIENNFIQITLKSTSKKKHQRIIPIHKNILDLIEYQKKHSKYKYLFFDFEKENEVKNAGKRVNSRLKKIINENDKSFHSLRKNFSQEIELNTTSEEKTKKYLMGHSMSKDVTHNDYNKGKMNRDKLVDCINQITFEF